MLRDLKGQVKVHGKVTRVLLRTWSDHVAFILIVLVIYFSQVELLLKKKKTP